MNLFILQELVIVLAVSVLVISLSQKLKLPSVVGFLLTGILIGPSALRLVRDPHVINVLAEIGVVMLLFTIGLEFSLERLKQIKKDFWIGGGLQVVSTTLITALILRLLGVPPAEGIFYGFLVSLSSTAVVMKILADRAETDAPQGRFSLGVLLFQDVAIVPMIALVPILANAAAVSWTRIALRFSLSLALVGAAFFAALFLAPRILAFIVRIRIRELFIITSLLACLGMALLTSSLGLSLALGAFLAGIILSESEFSHQVVSDILPFRALFNSLFFISIGMLLDLESVWNEWSFVLVLAISIFSLKTVAVFLTAKVLKKSSRIALLSGLALAQVGEFSFVLASVGRRNDFLPDFIFQGFIASSVLTILATPFLIGLSPALADMSEKFFGWRPGRRDAGAVPRPHNNHVIIAGFGLNGQNLARVLKEAGIGYVILELNPDTVRQARACGESIIFGDVASKEILADAGVDRAKAVVFAISDPRAARRGVKIARELSRDVSIIVRTRFTTEIEELYRLGADAVIPEEFETSIEIFTRVLEEFHVPKNIVDAQVKLLRSEHYGMLRGSGSARPSMEKISELLTAGTAETFFVAKDTPAEGRTLGELDLRKKTGATVIAVVRGEQSFTGPSSEFRIQEGDTLVLVASHKDMDRAFQFLERSS
jgi:CPA2 family monovalent cation:H+ antiporter-2